MENGSLTSQLLGTFTGFGNDALAYFSIDKQAKAASDLKQQDLQTQQSIATTNFGNILAVGVLVFAAIFVVVLFTRK